MKFDVLPDVVQDELLAQAIKLRRLGRNSACWRCPSVNWIGRAYRTRDNNKSL
jgi:hypothetical protein